MKARLAIVAAASLLLLADVAWAQRSIDGHYLDSDGYVEITVAPCGNFRCGTITRIIRHKPGETGLDRYNDNPALRGRPILGIRVLYNLRWSDGAWRGTVYNPEDGNTYRSEVRPGANGTLEVKGCLAIICRTRVWPAAT